MYVYLINIWLNFLSGILYIKSIIFKVETNSNRLKNEIISGIL